MRVCVCVCKYIYMYMYIYIYILFTKATFSRKSIMMIPFIFRKTISIALTDLYAQNFSLTRKSVRFHSKCCLFDTASFWKTHV